VPAGAVLFRQGEPGDLLYVVESGSMRMERTAPDGAVTVLAVVGPGQHFGEMAPLFDLPRSAAAVAGEDSVLTSYTLSAFTPGLRRQRLSSVLAGGPRPSRTEALRVGVGPPGRQT